MFKQVADQVDDKFNDYLQKKQGLSEPTKLRDLMKDHIKKAYAAAANINNKPDKVSQ